MRRALPLALAAFALAGCGGGGSRASLSAAAAYVPADADAFVAFETNANWRQFARIVLGRVPPVPHGAREAAFALEHGKVVAVSRSGTPPARALAGDARYRAALHAEPGSAAGVAYVRGDVAVARLEEIPGFVVAVPNALRRLPTRPGSHIPSVGGLAFRWGAVWLTRDGIGARLRTVPVSQLDIESLRALEQVTGRYRPALFDEIPADARSVLDLQLAPSSFELLPKLPAPVAALFTGDPIVVAANLDLLAQGETALYTRAGGEVTLVTQPADTNAAQKAVDQLRTSLKSAVALHVATIGGQFVVSTSAVGIAAFRGGGPKLSSRVQLPALVTGVVYSANRFLAWGADEGNDPTFTLRFISHSR